MSEVRALFSQKGIYIYPVIQKERILSLHKLLFEISNNKCVSSLVASGIPNNCTYAIPQLLVGCDARSFFDALQLG